MYCARNGMVNITMCGLIQEAVAIHWVEYHVYWYIKWMQEHKSDVQNCINIMLQYYLLLLHTHTHTHTRHRIGHLQNVR
jgi:hypothetical protein